LLFGTWLGLSLLGARTAYADRAVPPSRIESARGMALGTGARAAAASTQAQADNPANLVVGGLYHLESFVGYDPTFKRTSWGGSVVDSMTGRLAAGASARMLFGDNDAGGNKGWEAKVGLAFPIIEQLSIGLAGRYANFHVSDQHAVPDRPPVVSAAPVTEQQPVDQTFRLKHFTLDAAATLRPVPGLAIAGLAYNLIDTKSKLAPMTVGGGLAFTSGSLTLGGDVLVDLNKQHMFPGPRLTLGGGVEYLASNILPLRLGYAYDQGRKQSFITAGSGYVDPRFAIQISLRQSVSNAKETSLFFAASVFVQ
jgi:opacity protein-like surface antigen